MSQKILVLNGPNLNMLGKREPEIYGATTLADIESMMTEHVKDLDVEIEFFQSNSETALIEKIQEAMGAKDGVIINPASYSHTSLAIADSLRMLACPIVEVHLTNIHQREAYRHHSFVSAVAKGVICGLGIQGYTLALDALVSDFASAN